MSEIRNVRINMKDEILEKYHKSGQILARALEKTKKYIKAGRKVINVCKFAENEILKTGADLAFPLNIGINDVAAHYTSPINDESIIPDDCLVKLDLGASVDGYLSDSALTVRIGDSENLENHIIAANESLSAAIKMIKEGVTVNDIGTVIENVISKYNLKPIKNLSGHQMQRFNLHSGVSVPNIKTKGFRNGYKFKKGDVFAVEPFTTEGGGAVYSGNNTYIYSLRKKSVKRLPAHLKGIIEKIWSKRRKLPFSLRWVKDMNIPIRFIKQLLRRNIFYKYPVLIEVENGVVAQAEHTLVVNKDSCTVFTQR
ncbi:MAG: type II methionyl aminopeptidase [Candidatus Lokiarchaeota archaeon]|nr:type II methionyl aminopeptidase [Candidatus Lokiarchaeota archaeon]